jgi:hypothetical protein
MAIGFLRGWPPTRLGRGLARWLLAGLGGWLLARLGRWLLVRLGRRQLAF